MLCAVALVLAGVTFFSGKAAQAEEPLVRLAHMVPGMVPLKDLNRSIATLSDQFVPPPPVPGRRGPAQFFAVINQLDGKCEKIHKLRTREISAPSSSWISDTRYELREKQHAVFREVQEILFGGRAYDYASEMQRQRDQIKELRAKLSVLAQELTSAPRSGSILERTRRDILLDMKFENVTIASHEQNKYLIIRAIMQRFATFDISLDYAEVAGLMDRIDVWDLLYTIDLLNYVGAMSSVLRTEFDRTHGDISRARALYRIHVVLLDILVTTQETYLSNIRDHYMPRVQKLIEEAGLKLQLAQRRNPAKNRRDPSGDRQGDVQSHLLTKTAAIMYATHLNAKIIRILASLPELKSHIAKSYRLLETSKSAPDLKDAIERSRQVLALFARQQVPVKPRFASVEIRHRFIELTAEMRNMN